MVRDLVVIRPGGLGDTLLLAPGLVSLKNQHHIRLHLVGYSNRIEPLRQVGLTEGVADFDAWLSGENQSIPPPSKAEFISFIPLPHDRAKSHRIKTFPPFPQDGSNEHVAHYLAGCLGAQPPLEKSSPLECLIAAPDRGSGSTLWVHPGAGGADKRWGIDSFLRLAEEMRQTPELKVRFLLGEADLDLEDPIRSEGYAVTIREKVIELSHGWKRGDLYVGNDSGVTHFAGLCGLDTVALFGPTDPRLWRPYGAHVLVIRGRSKGAMPVYQDVSKPILHLIDQRGKLTKQ